MIFVHRIKSSMLLVDLAAQAVLARVSLLTASISGTISPASIEESRSKAQVPFFASRALVGTDRLPVSMLLIAT